MAGEMLGNNEAFSYTHTHTHIEVKHSVVPIVQMDLKGRTGQLH